MSVSHPIRRAAEERLKDIRGAFLRCDRGNALYVTNVLVRTDEEIDWKACGFEAQVRGKMTYLVPDDSQIDAFERWAHEQCNAPYLMRSVANAVFSMEAEDTDLWVRGIKCLEMRGNAAEYEKAVRQRAAVCLRQRRGGGTLALCALIADMMRESLEGR